MAVGDFTVVESRVSLWKEWIFDKERVEGIAAILEAKKKDESFFVKKFHSLRDWKKTNDICDTMYR